MSVNRENLKAFLDGELSPIEMAEMREALDLDPALAQEAEQLRSLSAAVQELEPNYTVQGLEDTLRALERSRRPSIGIRMWPLAAAVGAFGVIALSAKLVQAPAGQADSVAFSESAKVASAGNEATKSVGDAPLAAMESGESFGATKGAAGDAPANLTKQAPDPAVSQRYVRPAPRASAQVGSVERARRPAEPQASAALPSPNRADKRTEARADERPDARVTNKVEEAERTPLVVEVESPEEAEALIRGYAQLISATVVEEHAERDTVSPTRGDQNFREKAERPDRNLVLELEESQVAEVRSRIPQLLQDATRRQAANRGVFDSGAAAGFGGPGGSGRQSQGGVGGGSPGAGGALVQSTGGQSSGAQSGGAQGGGAQANNAQANNAKTNSKLENNQASNLRAESQSSQVASADALNFSKAGATKPPIKRAAGPKYRLEVRIRAKAKSDR